MIYLSENRRNLAFLFALILVVLASLWLVSRANAQASDASYPTDNDVNAVAKKLYCPVCPNTPLDVCETKACQDWRAQIRDELSAGWTEDQILAYFVEQYGERVLAEPNRSGFTSFVWILPVIGMAVGVGIVWQVVKSWRRKRQAPPRVVQPMPHIKPEVLAKLEKELREMD